MSRAPAKLQSRPMSAPRGCSRAFSITSARARRSIPRGFWFVAIVGAGIGLRSSPMLKKTVCAAQWFRAVPVHDYFSAEWQKPGLSTREYLFDLFPARASVYGVETLDEFLVVWPAALAENGRLSWQAFRSHADSQRRARYASANFRSLHPAAVWRNGKRGVGQSQWRAHRQIGGLAQFPNL